MRQTTLLTIVAVIFLSLAKAKATRRALMLPGPHSPLFAPDHERTIKTGAAAFTLSVMELMGTRRET